jgi:hypothetical protein
MDPSWIGYMAKLLRKDFGAPQLCRSDGHARSARNITMLAIVAMLSLGNARHGWAEGARGAKGRNFLQGKRE